MARRGWWFWWTESGDDWFHCPDSTYRICPIKIIYIYVVFIFLLPSVLNICRHLSTNHTPALYLLSYPIIQLPVWTVPASCKIKHFNEILHSGTSKYRSLSKTPKLHVQSDLNLALTVIFKHQGSQIPWILNLSLIHSQQVNEDFCIDKFAKIN